MAIADLNAITEYRKRRAERLDKRRLDDDWITIKGTHVLVDDEGQVTSGPEKLKNLPAKKRGMGQSLKASVSAAYKSGSTGEVKRAVRSALADTPVGYSVVSHGNVYKKIGDDKFEFESPSGDKLEIDARGISKAHSLKDEDSDLAFFAPGEEIKGAKQTTSKFAKEMTPFRDDYDYEDGDNEEAWLHKNVGKLMPLYESGGSDAIDSEWYKYRMADTTKNLHQITKAEADEAMYDNEWITQSLYDGWFRNADSSYKPKLTNAIVKDEKTRNAALNLAYENYRHNAENPVPFEEFLTTPIKLYRGESGQKYVSDDVFDAYSFDKKTAEGFANKGPNPKVLEIEVRPIDTFGSMRAVGEAEIWVPRDLIRKSQTDSVERTDGVDWEWHNPVKWAFEDHKATQEKRNAEAKELYAEALESIIIEAETLKTAAVGNGEYSDELVGRCIDEIQRTVMRLTALGCVYNTDSAFFSGELDDNLGENEVLYAGDVDAYRERRQKRLDARNKPVEKEVPEEVRLFRERRQARLDAKEEEGRWVTTENDHKIHINEEGVPDKGNPHVIKAMTSGTKTPDELGKVKVKKTLDKVGKSVGEYKAWNEKVSASAEKYARANKEFKQAERKLDFVDRIYKKTLDDAGIKESDGEALKKEVEDLKKQKDANPLDLDISAKYNRKNFLLAEYEDVYGEETKEYRAKFGELKKANDEAKKELDGHIEKRRAALKEAKEHMAGRDAQSLKFYSDSERNDIKDTVLKSESFRRMTDEDKEKISASLDNASDAQLALLNKTIGKVEVMRVADTVTPDKCSHYREGSGNLYMEDDDMGNPRVLWHEYGHFLDDSPKSGMDIGEVTRAEGTIYEGYSTRFSSVLRDNVKIYGEDAAKDLQEMFERVAPGKIEVKTNDSDDWLNAYGKDDPYSDAFSMTVQEAFDKVCKEFINNGPDGGDVGKYYRSIGYPTEDERPKRSDYIESYVTPKRKLEREREKFKGASEEYTKKLMEFYDKQEAVRAEHPDFYDVEHRLYAERGERERKLPAVTDCMCAVLHGKIFSIYGCHDPNYYRTGYHAENEWAANIHQMMFMGEKESLDFLTSMMPRTMKKVKAAYNEYLWRNIG